VRDTVYHALLGAALALGITVVGLTAASSPRFPFPSAVLEAYEPAETSPAEAAAGQRIDINTASAAELEALPGIGPKLAQEIVAYRKEHGRFRTRRDLMQVKGIGEKTYEKLEGFIRVG